MVQTKKQLPEFNDYKVAVEFRGTILVRVPIGVPYSQEMAEAIALSRVVAKLDDNVSAQDSACGEFYEDKVYDEYPEWSESDVEHAWDKSEVNAPDGEWENVGVEKIN